jgi:hypothetical protein
VLIYLIQMWIRFTVPRLRIDQIMDFCWKFLVPILLLLLVGVVLADKIGALYISGYLDYLTMGATGLQKTLAALPRTMVLLSVNVVVGGFAAWLIARHGRRERDRLGMLDASPMAPIESGAD